jgi:hypothetical protein
MHAEGWYRDPYGLHADRWFSNGRPAWSAKSSEKTSTALDFNCG